MPDYKTPGVYIEEISTLPPSIAATETALPVFIGYTEKATDPMPLRSIYEAVMLYLAEANLHDPLQFVAPKTIGESLEMVR